MSDLGVCAQCSAGDDGIEVELNEAGLCESCAAEEGGDGLGPVDMGDMNDT